MFMTLLSSLFVFFRGMMVHARILQMLHGGCCEQ